MHTQSHRHFVAVPLACLALIAAAGVHAVLPANSAVLTGSTSVPDATVIDAGEVRRTVDIGWQLQAILEPHSRLSIDNESRISFLAGEAILSIPGYAQLTLSDDRFLTVLDAVIWVRRDGGDWSIAPLNAPVLFRGDHTATVLPAGTQLRIGVTEKLSPVPLDWMRQKTADASTLILPEISSDAVPSVHQNDLLAVAAFFRTSALLSGDDIRSLLSLGKRIDQSGVLSGLMAFRLGFHPGRIIGDDAMADLRSAFLASPIADEMIGAVPSLVLSAPKPVAPWLIDQWSADVLRQGMSNPRKGITLLRQYQDVPVILKQAGYPLQADAWQSVLTQGERTLLPLLTEDERSALAAQIASHSNISHSSSSSPHVDVARFTEKQLLTLTRRMLADHGVLMGTETQLLPLAGPPQGVRVIGIFIAEEGRDVPYEFIFDPAMNSLSKIIRDGTEMPNSVPTEVFFRSLP